MIRILIAGRDASSLSAFQSALNASNTHINYMHSVKTVLTAISAEIFDLLVVDEKLGDMQGLELIRSVVAKQPMLNCALVSSLPTEEFHDASEGLGILMQLPNNPGFEEALQLLAHLNKIQSHAKNTD